MVLMCSAVCTRSSLEPHSFSASMASWGWCCVLASLNMLWGCSATSAVSVLPCTGGRTAEHALGLFSYQCCVRAALYRGQDCRTCSGVVQLPVLCPCCLVQGAGLQNMLWGCSATSAVSVLPCTGGRTAEHALGLFSYKCCVRAALYRGQDCRTCSGVVQLPVLCPCCLVQGAGLQNMLWGLRACLTWALGFLGLSHLGFMGLSRMGSGVCGPVLKKQSTVCFILRWDRWACSPTCTRKTEIWQFEPGHSLC